MIWRRKQHYLLNNLPGNVIDSPFDGKTDTQATNALVGLPNRNLLLSS